MSTTDAVPTVIPRRDANAVMLLSLDLTRPFLPVIGLAIQGEFEWTDTMRDLVRAYRRAFERTGPAVPGRNPDLLAFTRARLGSAAEAVLRWWLADIYAEAPSDHPAYRIWEDVTRYALHYPVVWGEFGLTPARTAEIRRRFEALVENDEFSPLWEAAITGPLSDWDLHLHAVNAWNDDLEIPTGPGSSLALIERNYSHMAFWDGLVRDLSADEQRALQQAAQQVVDTTPELRYTGTLPPLASMRMDWP